MEFYILNQNEEVTATLSTDSTGEHTPVYSAVVDEKLGSYDTLELSIPSGVEHDLDIKEEYYIVFEDIKGFREYIINEVVDVDDGEISRTITAELSSIELLDEIIQTNLTGNNPTIILTNMLKNTRWTIGNVDPSIYNSTFSEETEMVSVLEGIDLLSSSFNAEVSFSYAVAGNKITKRFVNLHKQMGANNGKRFEVDKDVTSIKRTIDTSSIKTAIIPFGAEPEEGKARLNIKDLVWSKAAGNPVDKPKGQEWIGDPTALANWGKNNADGSRRHRFLAQEINVETAAELATMAWVQLGQYTKPKTTYEAVAMDLYTLTGNEDLKHEYVNLGDTVVITDYYFAQPLVVQTRVSELKRDLLEPLNNDLVFGDSLELFSTSKQADRLETIKKELSNRIELVRQSADGKSDTYMGSDEPISPNEKDMWYRPHPTIPNETQFLIFNGLTWDIILDTANLDSVGKEVIAIIEQADRDREQAEADFESAKTAAKAYTDTKASEFDTKVEAVKTDLSATKIKADKAITDSETAIAEAGFAKVDATTAKQNAVTAISTANTAKTNAGTALTAAQTAVSNSGTALTNAQTALDRVGEVEEDTGTLQTSYDALTQTVGLKADKTTVNGITQTVTQQGLDITANATAVGLKADKTAVDTINQTVTKHTTDIKATSDGLALKAEKSLVDSINSTVGTHTTQIKATSDGLALKAEKSLVDTVKSTVDTHTTQIKATSDGLALKAESNLVNTINGTVNTHTGQISANSTAIAARLTSAQVDSLVAAKKYVNETTLNATANGLSTQITQVSTDLSNLEIGGRNYFTKSHTFSQTTANNAFLPRDIDTPNGLRVVGNSSSNGQVRLNNVITENGWWTVSFDIKGSQSVSVGMTVDICDLGSTRVMTNATNTYTRVSVSVKVTNYSSAMMNFVDFGSIAWAYFWIDNIKVEKGQKATDWSDAPEDMATLEKFTTLEATVNGINTVVGTKASQSQVTQLATQVSSKVESAAYNSKMTQLDSAINLRVESSKVISQINLSTEGILLQGKRIQLDGDVTMTSAFVTDIKAKSLEAVYADIATLRTKFLTADLITSTHLKSDTALITKLFATDANIGVLTSKTAFINSVKAVDIAADRITAGTLNAANVNIINLNASKIATGTVTGVNSSWNLNTGTMNFKNPSTGDSLNFTQGQIRFENGAQTRFLNYNAEGLQLVPGAGNTGTSKNTSLYLIGGGSGSYQYIQFVEGGGPNNYSQRLEAEGGNIRALVADGGRFEVRNNNSDKVPTKILASGMQTWHSTGDYSILEANRWETPRYDNRNLMISPSGSGIVMVGDRAGYWYGVKAKSFDSVSSRKLKTNIEDFEGSGLEIINDLKVVEYNMKQDLSEGIDERKVGLISEDSPSVAGQNNESIDMYKLNVFTAKAVQELSNEVKELKQQLLEMRN